MFNEEFEVIKEETQKPLPRKRNRFFSEEDCFTFDFDKDHSHEASNPNSPEKQQEQQSPQEDVFFCNKIHKTQNLFKLKMPELSPKKNGITQL